VATDAVAGKIMGYNPKRIKHIVNAYKLGLGNLDKIIVMNDGGKEIPRIRGFKPSYIEAVSLKFATKLQSSMRLRLRRK